MLVSQDSRLKTQDDKRNTANHGGVFSLTLHAGKHYTGSSEEYFYIMPDIQIPAEARAYLEDIISYMDLSEVEPEVKEQLVQDMFQSLDRFMHARTIDALPDDQLDAYEQLVNSGGSPNDLQQFFAKHIPNLQQVLTSAAAEFKLKNIPQSPTERE